MSSLDASLSIATRALMADQGAVEVTSNNIANVNTPGYSRQRPVFEQSATITEGSLTFGTGADLQSIQSIRDRVLDLRIQQEFQQQGQVNAYLSSVQQAEAVFNNTQGGGIDSAVNAFFNNLLQLSATPADSTARQAVVSAGQTLTATVRQAAGNLVTIRKGLDTSVQSVVGKINQLTGQIATLNAKIAAVQATNPDGGALTDQRDELVRELAQEVNVSVVNADGGETITTAGGLPLVAGSQTFQFGLQTDPSTGLQKIMANGQDLTSEISDGELGGLLKARDQSVPAYMSQLDQFAYGFANAFNAAHQAGYDGNGNPAGNFFVPPTATAGAALQFSVQVSSGSQVAASSDGTSGSNANANNLVALQNGGIINGQTPTAFLSGLTMQVGSDVSNAQAESDAENLALQQLQNQRSALSGVSLDEEASNLIRFQNAFAASARVISVINELTQTVVNMGTGQ